MALGVVASLAFDLAYGLSTARSTASDLDAVETPVPTDATDLVRWIGFLDWTVGDTSLDDDVSAFLDGQVQPGDPGLAAVAEDVKVTTTRLLAYLASHPPADCYADVHAAMVRELTHIQAGATAFIAGDVVSSNAEIDQGIAAGNDVTELIPIAGEACD